MEVLKVHRIGKELGVDPSVILLTSHGRRSIDTLAEYDQNVCHIEGLIPREYGADAVEIPGARSLLASLEHAHAPWIIVTSGTRPLVTGWLDVMGLAHPDNMVVAEDVSAGKPAPECYRLGIDRLTGLTAEKVPGEFLVIEDSPAGVQAGKAAGCQVIGLATTHRIEQLRESGADWIVQDLRSVVLVGLGTDGTTQLEVRNALQL
ncbi:MAG: hypothetical protein Q9225_006193 [Loekoesia sp. 1 TL-2023]